MTTRPTFLCIDCGEPATWQQAAGVDEVSTVAMCDSCAGPDKLLLPKVGQHMMTVVFIVASEPGITAGAIARLIYEPPNQKQGFKVIHRARLAGLIDRVERTDHLEFTVTPLGRCLRGMDWSR